MFRRPTSVFLLAVLAAAVVLAAGSAADAKPTQPSKTVTGVAKLYIGWVYTDEEYTGQHAGRLVVNWKSCAKAGGGFVDFPKGSHVYGFRDVPGNKNGSRMARDGDQFVSQPYIGAAAKPGNASITLTCRRDNGHVLGKGKLKVTFARKPMTFHAADIPQTLIVPWLYAGATTVPNLGVSIPACSEPGISTITVTSQAFAPDPATGSRTITLTRENPMNMDDNQFQGSMTGATDTAPGDYPITITCGSGPIGTGTITLRPAL